ncbi:MAG: OB-fold nucleic acid binding domain-containing protein, partial [Verrucomicrobiota bacterium]|nr:OB-fold nucleic acid binding domain-containing protein [Verrucomicrobiota bacterium]
MSEDFRLVSVAELLARDGVSVGDRVRLRGWVRTRRDSKAGLSFVQLHDGSCFAPAQVVAPGELGNYAIEVQHLTTGCSLIADGEVVASEGKGQSVELLASRIEPVGMVDDPETYPMPAKRHTFEYLREQAHLRVRTNAFSAMARVRHCLANAIHRYYHENGFYW